MRPTRVERERDEESAREQRLHEQQRAVRERGRLETVRTDVAEHPEQPQRPARELPQQADVEVGARVGLGDDAVLERVAQPVEPGGAEREQDGKGIPHGRLRDRGQRL